MARPTAGGVVPHPSPALISSSRSTTSSAPTCRTAPGRGASLPSSSYFFVGKHHVLRSKMPTGPGDVVPHCPPALVSSSRSTTSSASKCRPAPGAWCLTALQPLFLRREAPRPAPHFPDRVRGRGASSLANPCSFVGKHHVRLPFSRPGPGAWCLTALQPLFLRRGAPRPAPHFPDRVRGRGASSLASPYSFVRRHHVRRLKHSAGFACGRILQNLDYSR